MTQVKKQKQQSIVFRPLVQKPQVKHPLIFKTNCKHTEINLVPYSYVPHTTIDLGAADPKTVRSSFLIYPQNPETLKQTGVPFGLVLRPFSEQENNKNIFESNKNLKCRCGGYFSGNSFFVQNKIYCSFCRVLGREQNKQTNNESILKNGKMDILLQKNQEKFYYIILFQMSETLIKNKIIQTFFYAVRTASTCISTDIEFCLIGYTLNQIYMFSHEEEVKVEIIKFNLNFLEFQMPFLLGKSSYKQEKLIQFLDSMIDYISELKLVDQNEDYLGDILEFLIKTQPNLNKKIIVLQSYSTHKGNINLPDRFAGIDKLTLKENKNRKILQKQFELLYFQSEQNNFGTKLNQLLTKFSNNSIDLFLFPKKQIDLCNIKKPVILSGGSIFLYENFNQQNKSSEFYYDAYRLLTRFTIFNVEITSYISQGVDITSIILDQYEYRRKFKLNSLNEDHVFIINLSKNQKTSLHNRNGFQFVLKYKSHTGTYQRVINYTLFKANVLEDNQIISGFDPEAAIRILMSNFRVQERKKKIRINLKKYLIQKLKLFRNFLNLIKIKLIQTCKKLGKVEMNNYQLYLVHIFFYIYRFKRYHKTIASEIYEVYKILNCTTQMLAKIVYPKTYKIHQDKLQNNLSLLPTWSCNLSQIEKNYIHIMDKGYKLFLILIYLEKQILEQLFGTSDLNQIQNLTYIQNNQEKYSSFYELLNRIRKQNRDCCEPLELIASQQKFNRFEKELFIENAYLNTNEDDYVIFFQQYMEDFCN